MVFRLDTNGGLIAVWQIYVNFINDEFYAQRIDADGIARWKENGVPICTAGGHQDEPFFAQSGNHQFFVGWLDYRDDYGDESNNAIYG